MKVPIEIVTIITKTLLIAKSRKGHFYCGLCKP